jgi:mannose-1-phosphate guanylyltransferase
MLEQLKNFDKKRMIIEPCRKGTTNCTLLAARHIRNFYKGKEDNSKILFIHADHIFDNDNNFTNSIKKAFAINNKGAIVIGGKKPTSAQTKYGYVKIEKNSPYIYKVLEFKEKPTLEVAKKLCKDGNYY